MAEIRYKIDYTEPENVNSEVPGEQTIRGGADENTDTAVEIPTLATGDKIENPEDYVLSPVVTITKNEATYTKGDIKLQKVSVTENVSIIRNGVYQTIKPESYPPVHSDVIPQQPIRMDPEKRTEEKKTRIPTKFKQVANRVRRERSMPNRIDGEIVVPPPTRRSSIPRLKTKPRPKTDEDEFDKIYTEIVDSPVDIDVSLLNNKVDDPAKVDDCFEEIIHDYDEGKNKPISIERPVASKIPRGTEKISDKARTEVSVEKPASTNKNLKGPLATEKVTRIETSKIVERTNGLPSEKTKSIERQISKDKRKSIDKPINVEKVTSTEKSRTTRLEKASVETPTSSEIIRNIEKTPSTDKTVSTEKPKSRIPMLKRKSEAEIEVPKSIQPPKTNAFAGRIRVQDAINKFSKDDDKAKKTPIKTNASERVVVDNDDVKGIYQRTVSRTVGDGEKYEVHTETVQVQVSYESDIAPANVVTNETSIVEVSTVEIVELTPAMEIMQISHDIQEVNIEPCIVEILEAPPTAPISENNNSPVYIQEITEPNSPVTKTKEIELKQEQAKVENEPPRRLTPIRVVSTEELVRKAKEMSDFPKIPQEELDRLKANAELMNANIHLSNDVESLARDEVTNNKIAKEHNIVEATPSKNSQNDNIKDDLDNSDENATENYIDKDTNSVSGKVSRMISRLRSKDDKNEPKQEPVEELPKPKSVLSKIAMFERQEPIDTPRLKGRDLRHKVSRPTHDPTDYRPKIINKVLKPVQRKTDFNDDSNTDENEFKSLDFNHVAKTMKVEAINVEILPVSTVVKADEAVSEEAAIVSELTSNNSNNKEYITEATNPAVQTTQNYTDEVELTPAAVEYVEIRQEPVKFELKDNLVKTEDALLTPIEFEHVEPIQTKRFEPKIFSNKEEDTVTIHPENETVQFDTAKRKDLDSPFDFTPTEHSHRVRNYDDDLKETPSLDYALDRLNKYRPNFNEPHLKKSKSTAELDIGDAVRGKVHEMIVRMKSVDRLVEKKEVISAKERPRKKSVSEKILLFEGKLAQTTTLSPSRSVKTAPKRIEDPMTPAELEAKISALASAKLTFGRMTNMTYVVLGNGQEMPVLATGTALLDKQLTRHIIAAAIDLGYRAIDTAFVYGNEKEVGEGIRAKIQDGTVRREDLFIINKLWSTYHRQELVEGACRRSLEAMGLDYFDLYLVHNPMSFKEGNDPLPKIASVIQYSKHDYLEAWYGMEQLVAKGLVRAIGVSNFNSAQLQRVLDRARVKPVVNMVECHPYLSQQRLDDFCADRNVKLLAFGVLGSKGTPLELKGSTAAAIDDPLIQVMAAGLGVSPAQLLIRFQIESGRVVVTKSSTAAHLWDNLQALTFNLTDAQLDAIRALNRNKRTFTFKGMGDTHKNYPFNIAF